MPQILREGLNPDRKFRARRGNRYAVGQHHACAWRY
jgi:hypothetical protein